jgi:hypothetical protein
MPRSLSRRSFLSAATLTAAGLSLPRLPSRPSVTIPPVTPQPTGPEQTFAQPQPVRINLWGRITDPGTPVRVEPGLGTGVVEWLHRSAVKPLFEILHAQGSNPHNDVWYRTDTGYLYTSSVQPMQPYHMPAEVTRITTTIEDAPGFWVQVIVPYTVGRVEPSGSARVLDDGEYVTGFYASVHRVVAVEPDAAGYLWYRVFDDKPKAKPYYLLARHVRMVPPSAFEPIHPGVDKHIVVTLKEQRIDAYEGDTLVFSTLTSSGGGGFGTPPGDWAVIYKQPSRHMYSDPTLEAFSDPNYFDLPGVPFNMFFTTMGHAMHGTYWHGDYGRPRSHGCLNVTPDAAHWLYRWTEPHALYSEASMGSATQPGTPVTVV